MFAHNPYKIAAVKIERLHLKNFRALHGMDLKSVPPFAVSVGANGTS